MGLIKSSRIARAVIGLAIAVVISISSASATGAGVGETKVPAPIDEVLWWLPSDTETVMVAPGPVPIQDLDWRGPDDRDLTFALRLFTLMALSDRAKRDLVGHCVVSLAVSGSRRFEL